MNMHTDIVTSEMALSHLTETMRLISASPGRTPEEAVQALSAHFNGHLHITGRFSTAQTIWNFPEITFTGAVLGEPITHTIWCY